MNSSAHPELVGLIANSNKIYIFTGAGVSTSSGIRDFRGPQGVWKERQPVMYQDFMRSEEARVEYWEEKAESFPSFKAAEPNDVHLSIAKIEQSGKLEILVTQNIDGLHAKAGVSQNKIVELHGTNTLVQCQTCKKKEEPEASFAFFEKHRSTPLCTCGGFLKPATISFGQSLNSEDLIRARNSAQVADLVIALGSTLSVYPAAEFPLIAAGKGAPYVIINRGPTEHDSLELVSLRLEGDVGELFYPAVEAAL